MSASVVLCTYNGVSFLPQLWQSLLAQTRLPEHIVVRDDASRDGTWELLISLRDAGVARGIDVSLARNPVNVGYAKNFERALAGTSGEVLFLCDQDDVWHPDKLATMLAAFEQRPRLSLLHADARLIGADGKDLRCTLFRALEATRKEIGGIHCGRAFDVLLRRNLATGAALAMRRSLLADAMPFPDEWVHDEWLAIVAAATGEVDCLETPLMDYRQHGANQIGAQRRNLAGKWARAGEPRIAYLEWLVRRGNTLLQRLPQLGPCVSPAHIDAVRGKLAHLGYRLGLPVARPRRLWPVLLEVLAGRYARYSTGLRAVAYDLLGSG
ncbi:MAG: glycosyltransferase family 2 protein [Pseudomonadota bacterium]|nr:glycosyltransferase family 2 protein [Pseudomonadota bacterium]